jgi:wyosine [tRNA(Phe)-imidazoG37] synthetase (radical SAM superfamily)
MFASLFGPVPSRRLGMSLGVDLVPRKVCSLDCVYCEVGRTTLLTVERREYVKFEKVVRELREYFAHNPEPDYMTFSGSGEPTLNSRIGDLVDFIKREKPHIPVAILTNGTTLHDPSVRRELLGADVVLPSLDAATADVFRRINRPHHSLGIEDCIKGLVAFRKEFTGEIWLEVFVLPGYNDTTEELDAIRRAVLDIGPDRVQLNTLDRPGTVEGLRAATPQELQAALDTLHLDNVEIIAAPPERKLLGGYRSDTETAILETIVRRPCTVDDLSAILGLCVTEINKYISVLEAEGKVEPVRRERGVFYTRKNVTRS